MVACHASASSGRTAVPGLPIDGVDLGPMVLRNLLGRIPGLGHRLSKLPITRCAFPVPLRRLDSAGALAMTKLPWSVSGVRLQPRDVSAGYLFGRLGAATPYDIWPALYGSLTAGRWGALRLERLGILRAFPRTDPTRPSWYGLSERGHRWLVQEIGCPEDELRLVSGLLRRANLAAWSQRNRLWASLIVASRSRQDMRLALVRPECELRRLWTPGIPVVPDMMVTLGLGRREHLRELSWAIELDSGCERISTVWRGKLDGYGSLARQPLYGGRNWRVLAVVPTQARAAKVAHEAAKVGVGSLIYFAVQQTLELGCALDPVVWTTSDLCSGGQTASVSLLLTTSPVIPGQQSRAAADRPPARPSGVLP